MSGEQDRGYVVATCERCSTKRGDEMKNHDRKRRGGWRSIAVAGAAMVAAAACSGCLYTAVPAMAGPSTTYQQPADSQPAGQEQRAFGGGHPEKMPAAETHGLEQRKLAAPLERVAQQHGSQPDCSQQQAQAAQGLERREIGRAHV